MSRFLIAMVVTGCASSQRQAGPPASTLAASGPRVESDGTRALVAYGEVAAVETQRSPPLRRWMAENRARAEMAKLLDVFSAWIMMGYMERRAPDSTEEFGVGMYIKAFSAATLPSVRLTETTVREDGSVVARAVLPLARFLELVQELRGTPSMQDSVLDFVVENAVRVHEEIIKKH